MNQQESGAIRSFFFWFINKQLIIMLTTQQCSKAWWRCNHRITRCARYPALTRYGGQIGVEICLCIDLLFVL